MTPTESSEEEMRLFVGCIPCNHEDQELISYFRNFGQDVSLVKPQKGTRSNSGFVIIRCGTVKTKQSLLNSELFFKDRKLDCAEYFEGERLRVRKQNRLRRRLFLPNLPSEISEEELKTAFSSFGPIEKIYKIKPKNKKAFLTQANIFYCQESSLNSCLIFSGRLKCCGYSLKFYPYEEYQYEIRLRRERENQRILSEYRQVFGDLGLKDNPKKLNKILNDEKKRKKIRVITKMSRKDERVFVHTVSNLRFLRKRKANTTNTKNFVLSYSTNVKRREVIKSDK